MSGAPKRVITSLEGGPASAFGEVKTVQPHYLVQVDSVYGLANDVQTFTAGDGSASAADGLFMCDSGTGVASYGLIRSQRIARYRPGQGMFARFTAMFDDPAPLTTQQAGLQSASDALVVGYNGEEFGFQHKRHGAHEIYSLQVTGGAGGSETLSLTLAGVEYSISLTSGTVQHNANEIWQHFESDDTLAWQACQVDDTVSLVHKQIGDKTGTYSFSSSTATGTLTKVADGADATTEWIPQSSWNGETATWLNPQKLNVYQISVQWLGAGAIRFYAESPHDADWQLLHTIHYTNRNEETTLGNPSLRISWTAANLGSGANTVVVQGASAAAGVEGDVVPFRHSWAATADKASIGTTLTNVMTIRARGSLGGRVNLKEVWPTSVIVSVDGNKPAVCELIRNTTLGGTPNYQFIDEDESVILKDVAGTTVTGGYVVEAFPLAKSGSVQIDLRASNIRLAATDTLTIAVRATSATTDAAVGLNWLED